MAYFQSGPTVAMPMPQQFQTQFLPPQTYQQHVSQQPIYPSGPYQQSHYSPQKQRFPPYQQHSRYHVYQQPQHYVEAAPPHPPKKQSVQTAWSSGAPHTPESQARQPQPPLRPSIEPDPLPPHSNPQHLSPTQSKAFEGPAPIPSVRVGLDTITDSTSSAILFNITREAVHMPSFLSTKPLLVVTRTVNASTVGSIRFKTLTTSNCDISVNGQQTKLKQDGFLHFRWCFPSTSQPNTDATWYFKRDKPDMVLEDAKKHGHAIARLTGDVLSFEKAGLTQETIDEVVMAFVALAEAARRAGKTGELTSAIGDVASAAGVAGGGGGA